MRRVLFTLMSLLVVDAASAYEFPLQFTAASNARGLTVIGYHFAGNVVTGDCSYYTVSACSGRGCHPITTHYYNNCTWGLTGNLLSVAAGEPPAQSPLYTSGTEAVYAVGGSSTTGLDTRGFGFVDTPAAHYSWQTPNDGNAVIPRALYLVSATFVNDGDLGLSLGSPSVVAQIYGTLTPSPGSASISGNSCPSTLAPGSTCTVTVSYDPTTIACTNSPYGYAYTGIALSLSTNSPTSVDFVERFTVTGVPICDGSDGSPAAGVVPGDGSVPGTPLTVERAGGGNLTLRWSGSCVETDTDYEVYEGQLGDFTSHAPRLCTTAGATTTILTPSAGSSYYLVVPRNSVYEGSYGQDSAGERPQGLSSCQPQVAAPCN
jgi:hypothetical protein